MEDSRMQLPGFVFSPSNEDIFKCYLKPLIEDQKDDYLNPIYKTEELYGENVNIELTFERALQNYRQYVNAEKIFDDSLWFFTKLKRHGTSNRFDRKAGVGTWTATDQAKTKYEDKKESLKGKFRTFAFTVPDNDGLQGTKAPTRKRISASASKDLNNNANWIMHEYSLEKDEKLYSDYVIVKIRRKRNTSSCSQEVQNEAAVEVEDVRATKTPHIANQYQLTSSDGQHEIAAPPTQDDQQGEYNRDLDIDSWKN
ncbi:NAC domain-containing protein 13-like [Papaver somniferum]|uniref:NAC domain-containing protein 13-like n=1 Tax=Papaver somniferum TaxID=3469 RepID=UPI000E6FB1A2|nr:NAC domain-containing protein 13-like [Papaver somniferum]